MLESWHGQQERCEDRASCIHFLTHTHTPAVTHSTSQTHIQIHTDKLPPSTQRKLNELFYRAGGRHVSAAHRRRPVTASLSWDLKILVAAPIGRFPATQRGSHKLDDYRENSWAPLRFSLSQSVFCFAEPLWVLSLHLAPLLLSSFRRKSSRRYFLCSVFLA